MQRGQDMTLDEFQELMTTPCTEREARQSCTDFAIRRAAEMTCQELRELYPDARSREVASIVSMFRRKLRQELTSAASP
jgi:hypothetical protein